MILTCPTCSRRYSVPLEALGEGRTVRCVMCSATWYQPAVDPAIIGAFAPKGSQDASPPKTSSSCLGFVLLASLFCLFFFCAAHQQIVARIPAMGTLYRALGISTGAVGEGLEIREISSSTRQTESGPSTVFSGEIINISSQPRSLPTLRISLFPVESSSASSLEAVKKALHFQQRKALFSWTHKLSQHKLLPNEKIFFETDSHSVPGGEFQVEITFEGAAR